MRENGLTLSRVFGGILLFLLAGCQSIPTGELQRYRATFDQTRQIGELILTDYAACEAIQKARKTAEQEREAHSAGLAADLVSRYGTKTSAREILHEAQQLDTVAIRMQAWEIAASYNEALASLATGVSREEVESSIDGLLDNLKEFPISDVADIAMDVVPYSEIIKKSIVVLQKLHEQKKFRESVLASSELMDGFTKLLLDDANDFGYIRRALLDGKWQELNIEAYLLALDFEERASGIKWNDANEIEQQVESFHAAQKTIYSMAEDDIVEIVSDPCGTAETEEDIEELDEMVTQLEQLSQQIAEIEQQYLAFSKMWENYVRLIGALQQSYSELKTAVERKRTIKPNTDDIAELTVFVRRSYMVYNNLR